MRVFSMMMFCVGVSGCDSRIGRSRAVTATGAASAHPRVTIISTRRVVINEWCLDSMKAASIGLTSSPSSCRLQG